MTKKSPRPPSFKDVTEAMRSAQPGTPPTPYEVSFTASAEAAYLEFRDRCVRAEAKGDLTNAHCTTFRMVDEAVRKLIPSDPTNPKFRLHKPLDGLFRIQKGRLRIAWIVHETKRALLIMYLSEDLRKAGDARDPYTVLNAMAKAGLLTSIAED